MAVGHMRLVIPGFQRGTTHAAFLRPASSEENLLLFSHQLVERKHGMETPKVAISCDFSVQPIS
jgi:hypothetical protein